MKEITKEILKYLGNENTKVEEKEDFKGNYYSYITDTIYLSPYFFKKENNEPKNISRIAGNLITICHECIHSVQQKYLHILNAILSNLGVVSTAIYIVLAILLKRVMWLKIVAIAIVLSSVIVRLILEIGAVNGSVNLVAELTEKGKLEKVSISDINNAKEYIKKCRVFALAQMILDKIIFLILLIIM